MRRSSKKERRIRSVRKPQEPHSPVFVPELLKLRDEGKISAAECAIWSSLIQPYDLLKALKDQYLRTRGFAIFRTKRHWRLFRIRKALVANTSVDRAVSKRSWSERGLYITNARIAGGLRFEFLGPPLERFSTPAGQREGLQGDGKHFTVKCGHCGWSVKNVKRVGRVKRRHVLDCPAAEFEIFPYIPAAFILRPPGYAFCGAKQLARSGRVPRGKGKSETKQTLVDRPLSRRTDLSAPDFYPDDN